VVIKSVARVSGKMSKVAVALRDGAAASGVTFDPVLACLGEDSVRMRAIRERMGGEAVQVLPWRSDPCEFVAEALFPAVVKDVVQSDKAGSLDERGFPRRMSKFIAYVSRFDEAKAIGAAGLNVKLAAALCGCFIMVERYEDGGVSSQGNGFGFDSRGGDTRGGWNDQATTRDDTRWNERDDRDDGWRGDTRENNRDDWRDDTRENARDDWRDNDSRKTVGIDIGDDGLDDLGWPDLVSPPGPAGRGALSNTLGSNSDSFSAETSAEFAADAEAVIFADTRTFNDDGDDDANWEEVGPGKVGVVTFGGNLGAGITGGCSFMGDQEEEEAETLGDIAAAATANRVKSPPAAGAADTLSFLDDDDDLDLDDELLEMDGDTLAEDELFGEDWS
jgi:transcription antitermination factor NusA-like protein